MTATASPSPPTGRRTAAAARARHALGRVLATVARSVAIFVPVFLVATFVTFALRSLSGLSPARIQLGEEATPEAIARVESQWGLDRPFLVQYGDWIGGVLHGQARRELDQRRRHLHPHRTRPRRQPVGGHVRPAHRRRRGLRPGHARGAAPHHLDRPRGHRLRHGDLRDAGLRGRDRPGGGLRGRSRAVPLRRVRRAGAGHRPVARPHHAARRRPELRRRRRRGPPAAHQSHRGLPRELRDRRAGAGAESAPDLLHPCPAQRSRPGAGDAGPEVPLARGCLRRHGVDLRSPGVRPVRQRLRAGR